jgi:cystathionine beta-lyase
MVDFDVVHDRTGTSSAKWDKYKEEDIIPLWVADMDFKIPVEIIDAIKQRADHGIIGYTAEPYELRNVIVERLSRLYDWQVEEKQLLFLPGVVAGLNHACKGIIGDGESVITATPVYHPFFSAPENWGRKLYRVPTEKADDSWPFPVDKLEETIKANSDIKLLLLCNPFNPIGRSLTREELIRIVEICYENKVWICSDEIHCELMLDGRQHIPTATVSPEAAEITMTMMAPTKTFNLAGLGGAFAVFENPELRKKYESSNKGMYIRPNAFAYTAMLSAYRDCEPWREELLKYLQGNCEYLEKRVSSMPGISMSPVEGTYLAWLDVSELKLNDAFGFFESAGLGFSDGAQFDGEGYMRLNFGCARATLVEACDRLEKAVAGHLGQ